MTAREAKRRYKLTEWAGRIKERSESGLTIKSWCSANNISPRVYYYWLKRVREYASQFLPESTNTELASMLPEPLEKISEVRCETAHKPPAVVPTGWTVCQPTRVEAHTEQKIIIEIGKSRITATANTDPALLKKVCRVMVEL